MKYISHLVIPIGIVILLLTSIIFNEYIVTFLTHFAKMKNIQLVMTSLTGGFIIHLKAAHIIILIISIPVISFYSLKIIKKRTDQYKKIEKIVIIANIIYSIALFINFYFFIELFLDHAVSLQPPGQQSLQADYYFNIFYMAIVVSTIIQLPFWIYALRSLRKEEEVAVQKYGEIGGWLFIFFALLALSIPVNLKNIQFSDPITTIDIFIAAGSTYTAILILQKKKKSIIAVKLLLTSYLFITFALSIFLFITNAVISNFFILANSTVVNSIWILYFFLSDRVRHTLTI